MSIRFGLPRVTAAVMLAGALVIVADAMPRAEAAVTTPKVKITKANFTAANGNNPPKADPQGTWEKPPKDGVDWKVSWDYGTGTGPNYKDFKQDGKIGIGGDTTVLPDADATGTWGPTGAENLQNPLPANTVIRARLLRKESGLWAEKAVYYLPIP